MLDDVMNFHATSFNPYNIFNDPIIPNDLQLPLAFSSPASAASVVA